MIPGVGGLEVEHDTKRSVESCMVVQRWTSGVVINKKVRPL